LFEKYKNKVQFLVVYVMEAHAKQEWPMGTIRSSIGQHKTIEERKIAANAHRAKNSTLSKFPFVIDTMDNIFYEKFGAWPETHLLIDGNGKLIWRSQHEVGEGTIKGLYWEKLVDKQLMALLSGCKCVDAL
jgi:hypothetical protein